MRKLVLAVIACSTIVLSARGLEPPNEPRKVDEFGDVCCDDEKARLDNFAHALREEADAQGYIIFYGGRRHSYPYCHSSRMVRPRRGEGEARASRLRPYLLMLWGFAPERIVVINGGYREEWAAEFWVVPKGAAPPTPTPTVKPQEIRFRQGRRATRRDYYCDV